MDVFFADDCSLPGKREGMGEIVCFGGILVPEEALHPLAEGTRTIESDYGIPAGTEIKWSPPRKNWIHSNLVGASRTDCYQQILQLATELNIKAVVTAWDTGRTTLKGQDAFEKCITYTFERVSTYLAKSDKLGLFIADRPGGGARETQGFLEGFLERVESGTEYVPPERIVLNALTTPSALVKQLQIADLVVGITAAMVSGNTKYAQNIFPYVRELFAKNAYGYIGGTGLKLFPNELRNLFFWLLDESTFSKVSLNAEIGLPHNAYPYCNADGLPKQATT